MILRRVIEHVKAQNWFAVGIDFVIVVLGVFVGIQVANWNAASADRRIAGKYLAEIAQDVQADIVEVSRVKDSALVRIGASAYILREAGVSGIATDYEISQSSAEDPLSGFESIGIPEVSAPLPEMRDRLWALASGVYFYDMNRSAYDALIGSGKIDLIADPRVKQAMREYYYLVNALFETERRTIQPARQLINEAGLSKGFSPEGRAVEAALLEAVKGDAAFAAAIASGREYAALHTLLCDAVDRKARELAQLLEAEKS